MNRILMKANSRITKYFSLILILLLVSCSIISRKDISFIPRGVAVLEMDKSKIDLDDGDSFKYNGQGIRVLGMDTPEIAHPEHGFPEEQPYGKEAAAMTAKIIRKAKRISYITYEPDRYGRMLAHIFVDGDLLSIKLIKAGLAYETISHYGDNGFPRLANRILKAARQSKPKDFIPPYKWREQHTKSKLEQPSPQIPRD